MREVRIMKVPVLCAIAVAVLSHEAVAAKKYIFSGWDLGDVTPQEVLLLADEFDKTACDGVAMPIGRVCPGWTGQRSREVLDDPGMKFSEFEFLVPVFRKIVEHPSLRESMILVHLAPTNRIAWADDARWRTAAGNLATAARLAKAGGLRGLVVDVEDYRKKLQYRHDPAEGDYAATCRLARRRAKEMFAAAFAEFPEMVVLSFQLFTMDPYYMRGDPVSEMIERRDLWPAFVNGILDAMPSTAKLVDGNENEGYHARAERRDFYKGVYDQMVAVLPLVAKENRVKYRSQVSVSFGLYLDSYICATNGGWYMPPVRGKRITRLEDNLRQATECADEYVWFWGEKGFYVDWPADLKERSGDTWRSSGLGTWRGKYFSGGLAPMKPWCLAMDGDFDLVARGVKDPQRCVREQYSLQNAAGTYKNLAPAQGGITNALGHLHVRVPGLAVDGWYGAKIKGRGGIVRGNAYFQHRGSWRWKLGSYRFTFGPPDAEGWREGIALVRIPDGATDAFCIFDGPQGEKTAKAEFRDFEFFKIR